ncbi:CRISPR-associated helicase Cas3' [Leucobacter allii]|uniref:CRISPR-associated helicase Cas3' n=1 Tax=Leucobacter allii TaxID=2932247 RepID=UPI001FD2AC9B|nr:CRISPR-associated helicase Cas3' [Leucobacter allii]UOR01724.1 CRISPR-associated helicase Cas3' [Leucobacter allii]
MWAKSVRAGDEALDGAGPVTHWLPLAQHLADSGAIAARLWDEGFWAPAIMDRLGARFGGDRFVARALVILLAATHDVGKCSVFVAQCPELADRMRPHGLHLGSAVTEHADRSAVRHELVSYSAFAEWAEARGADAKAAGQLASVLGSHHGRPLTDLKLDAVEASPALAGEGPWQAVRTELLDWVADDDAIAPHLDLILRTRLRQTDLVLLTGMLVVADWLASNADFFPLFESGTDPEPDPEARIDAAWDAFAPPRSWIPAGSATGDQLFAQRFALPEGARPHSAQRDFLALADRIEEPGLMILEAVMGGGKTEAALGAAEILARRFGRTGLFIAMPTQATTDAMFERLRTWANRAGIDASVFLAHGRSQLNDDFDTLVRESWYATSPARDAARREDGGAIAHRWFSGNRKGPLASLVVGTIDQLLFSALQSRHVALRHLAVAGKIVVIDEVHALDTCSGAFLERAIEWLGAYGVPTIMLSATLPAARRRALVRAYELGRRTDAAGGARTVDTDVDLSALDADLGYPAITASGPRAEVILPERQGDPRRVRFTRAASAPEALRDLLDVRLAGGGCAAVIRNTVREAQETAAQLRAAFPRTPVILAHARFLAGDRARKDRELLDRFGSPDRSTARPERAIVVATQVIEQSLDVDFDLLVTDIAPIDLVLQRAGRLHRHRREVSARPAVLRDPEIVILADSWTSAPPEPSRGTRRVYGDHLLMRTLAVLRDRDALELPGEIAPLVQQVYGDLPCDLPEWEVALAAAEREQRTRERTSRDRARSFLLDEVTHRPESLVGWAAHAIGDPEREERTGRAVVRDTEESIEVFALFSDDGMTLSTAPWWPGEAIPLDAPPGRALARTILRGAIRIPSGDCQRYARGFRQRRGIEVLMEDLKRLDVNASWRVQHARELEGELMVVFDAAGECRLPHATLRYTQEDGLQVMHDA